MSVVIDGRIRITLLCFSYIPLPVFTVSLASKNLVLVYVNIPFTQSDPAKRVHEGSGLRVNENYEIEAVNFNDLMQPGYTSVRVTDHTPLIILMPTKSSLFIICKEIRYSESASFPITRCTSLV